MTSGGTELSEQLDVNMENIILPVNLILTLKHY